MNYLVDIVNFNADASCLHSSVWLESISGGCHSNLYKWLDLYVRLNKKITLGLTGATISDMSVHNPETIELINKNPNIFEIILRPFSHDISLLRTREGFIKNFETGKKVIIKEFSNVTHFFLPPEFMLTNEQVQILYDLNIEGTFINSLRFKKEIKNRLPDFPYIVQGLYGTQLKSIPFIGELTEGYLNSLHTCDPAIWNKLIYSFEKSQLFSWRDGESCFLLPDGINREKIWLSGDVSQRTFIKDILNHIEFTPNIKLKDFFYHYYPIHSFTSWIKEFRMLGFIKRIQNIEYNVNSLSKDQFIIWLQVINSDILSSVEKDSPVIKLKNTTSEEHFQDYIIWRSERGVEGEEYLSLLEQLHNNSKINEYLLTGMRPHIKKLRGRINYLKSKIL